MPNTFVESLKAARSALKNQIDSLTKDLKELDSMITRYNGSHEEKPINHTAEIVFEKKGPTEAVVDYVMDPNVTLSRKFTAPEVRDHLEKLANEGNLNSGASNLLWTANDILGRLADQGKLVKHIDPNNTRNVHYTRANTL